MQYALPRPTQSIAIPLVSLALGAGGGALVAAIVADDDVIRLPAVSQPAEVQSQSSFSERPQEGVAARSIHQGPQASGLSEKSTDRSLQPTSNAFNTRPVEGAAVQATGSGQAPGLSEKSSDPSLQPSTNQNSLGKRP